MKTDEPDLKPELKDCPFCGNEAEMIDTGRTTIGRGQETAFVSCSTCDDVKTDVGYSEHREGAREKAAAKWNTRASAWHPIRSSDDLPKEDGGYLWQIRDVSDGIEFELRLFRPSMDLRMFAEMFAAWQKIDPYQPQEVENAGTAKS